MKEISLATASQRMSPDLDAWISLWKDLAKKRSATLTIVSSSRLFDSRLVDQLANLSSIFGNIRIWKDKYNPKAKDTS